MYGDDVWYLGPGERLGHAARLSINFLRVPGETRSAAKSLVAALLDDDLAPNGRPYSLNSICQHFTGISAFLNFLGSKGISALSAVTTTHFTEYIGFLAENERLNDRHLRSPRLFWDYRQRIIDALPSDPEAVPFWRPAQFKERSDENLTPRIPEDVLEPLIWWCTRFVDDFAADILKAREDHREQLKYMTAERISPELRLRRGETSQRARDVLERYRTSGEPLPGRPAPHAGHANFLALDREAGIFRGSTYRVLRDEVHALAEANGVLPTSYLPTEPTAQLLGATWIDRIAYDELPQLVRHLQTAAYILIAFFSGMRDSEVKHIRRGCVTTDVDDTGKLTMYFLDGVTFKGNTETAGRPARWVVAPVVQRAVAVLEAIADPAESQLFRPLREGTSHDRGDTKELVSNKESIRAFDRLTDWTNDFVAQTGRGPRVPVEADPGGHLTTRRFRRTLAWFIARRPGGMAAGALQYKHLSLQMFRGYAGESESGFSAEVSAEQSLARGEWLGAFAADARSALGRAKDEVVRRLEEMGRALGFAGRLPENPKQLARFLKRHDPHIYRGAAVTCVFDASKALCLRKAADSPDFLKCEPLKCGNAVFSPDDIEAWRDRAAGLNEVSNNEAIAPRVRARAAEHARRLTKFFDTLEHQA